MKISDIQVTPIHPERWGDDLDVVNAARVSFHKESEYETLDCLSILIPPDVTEDTRGWMFSGETKEGHELGIDVYKRLAIGDEKLIHYLAKHKHFSPFNHSFLRFRIKAPIFVARQLVKHKFLPWNEVSRRYVDEEPEFYFPDYWRKKADNVKQGSSEDRCEEMYELDFMDMNDDMWIKDGIESVLASYLHMIKIGVAPEQARMILPQNMMTEWIWSGTLGAFLDMLVLRLDPHTQKESQDVAKLIATEVSKYFPISFNARIGNGTKS